MKKYDEEEKRREKLKHDRDVLYAKIANARYPLQKLDINYGQNKGKTYSEDEDRFLLVRLNHHGIEREDAYDLLKRDIGEWPDFRLVLSDDSRQIVVD
jgi:SWI/SNF-related matrix-associated actin-dependent regulator of chromatin subfamily A member 5